MRELLPNRNMMYNKPLCGCLLDCPYFQPVGDRRCDISRIAVKDKYAAVEPLVAAVICDCEANEILIPATISGV